MPKCWKLSKETGQPGYCWNCHKYQDHSLSFQVWEKYWKHEVNEYSGEHCPDCKQKLDTKARCSMCRKKTKLIEYKNELFCCWCYVVVRTKELLDELDEIINGGIGYPEDIIIAIEDYFESQDGYPEEYKIRRFQ